MMIMDVCIWWRSSFVETSFNGGSIVGASLVIGLLLDSQVDVVREISELCGSRIGDPDDAFFVKYLLDCALKTYICLRQLSSAVELNLLLVNRGRE